jgi:hypothetical protein
MVRSSTALRRMHRVWLTTTAALLALESALAAQSSSLPLASVDRLQGGTSGSQGEPIVQFIGSPFVGGTLSIDVVRAAPGAPGLLGLGFAMHTPAIPVLGGIVHVQPDVLIDFTCDASGRAEGVVPTNVLPPSLVGVGVTMQALVFDPSALGGVALTDARLVRIGAITPLFPNSTFPLEREPRGLAVADVNGDGFDDVVSTADDAHVVTVSLGRPSGGFNDPVVYSGGLEPRAVVVADVDADGALDIVVAVRGNRRVGILYGVGDGSFAQPIFHVVDHNPIGLAVVDLEGDGDLDVVTAHGSNGSMSVLSATGGGAFAPVVIHTLGFGAQFVAVADVEGDGKVDVLLGAQGNAGLQLLKNLGGGSFAAPSVIRPNVSIANLRTSDFNGDGVTDCVFSTFGPPGALECWLGDGLGGFVQASSYPNLGGPFAAVDFDADGRMDLLAALDLLLGQGDGTFVTTTGIDVPSGVFAVDALDFNHDGRLDMVASLGNADQFAVFHSREDGSIAFTTRLPASHSVVDFVETDVNGDGWSDLMALVSADRIDVHLGGPSGFSFTGGIPTGKTAHALDGGDLNGDGHVDLVVSSYGDDAVYIHFGVGDGTFLAPVVLPLGTNVTELKIADLNVDGIADLVCSVSDDSLGALVYFGGSGGSLASIATIPIQAHGSDIAVEDLDLDGWPDIVFVDGSYDEIEVVMGLGSGTFATPTTVVVGTSPEQLVIGDVDEDGVPDVVLACRGEDGVFVLPGHGDGTFETPFVVPLSLGTLDVELADVDSNGVIDIIASFHYNVSSLQRDFEGVGVALGQGLGTFAPCSHFTGCSGTGIIDVRDFDRDGDIDVVMATKSPYPALTVYWNEF